MRTFSDFTSVIKKEEEIALCTPVTSIERVSNDLPHISAEDLMNQLLSDGKGVKMFFFHLVEGRNSHNTELILEFIPQLNNDPEEFHLRNRRMSVN